MTDSLGVTFTGTRAGMTPEQKETVADTLVEVTQIRASDVKVLVTPMSLHFGAAEGADREFHSIADLYRRDLNRASVIHFHPAFPEQLDWARLHQQTGDIIYPVNFDPIRRNRRMVDRSQKVIACPRSTTEEKRGSGTWATIRYARKLKRHLIVVWPDGTYAEENTP